MALYDAGSIVLGYHPSMVASAKTLVDPLREIVQDLLVPEMKATRVSIDALRTEMQLRDERTQDSLKHLGEKLDFAIDIRERLATLEARMPRQ